ncbi:hypothetical protein AN958_06213 [Leucoagaricus sp. SymC.cos]|nr:hypothetical protein AN958_06213 [Leucoagaricus sp. SymC.cos]
MKITFFCDFVNPDDTIPRVPLGDSADLEVSDLVTGVYEKYRMEFNRANVGIGGLTFFASPTAVPIKHYDKVLEQAADVWKKENLIRSTISLSTHPEWRDADRVGLFLRVRKVETGEESHAKEHQDRQDVKAFLASIESVKTEKAPPSHISKHPSSYLKRQMSNPIYNGHPQYYSAAPITIFSPALAKLKDALCNVSAVQPTPEEIHYTGKLFHVASEIYKSEAERERACRPFLSLLLKIKCETQVRSNPKGVAADSMYRVPLDCDLDGEQAVLYMEEWKNEEGSGGGIVQSAFTYRIHICRPQPLMDPMLLCGDPFVEPRVFKAAAVFHAISDAIRALSNEYRCLTLTAYPDPSRFLPRPTPRLARSSEIANHIPPGLRFLGRLHAGTQLNYLQSIFHATLDDKPVLVKFCGRYGADAHRLLTVSQLAPQLLSVTQLCAGILMVIMDFIDCRNALAEFDTKALPPRVLQDVKTALNILHDAGFVFGDLRRPNILVIRKSAQNTSEIVAVSEKRESEAVEWRAMLTDFDWAGRAGQDRYPSDINDVDIMWPLGVMGGSTMEKEDDWKMYERL